MGGGGGGVGVKITKTSSKVMLKLCSLDMFISKLLINKIENTIEYTNIWITETLFWGRIWGVEEVSPSNAFRFSFSF